MMGGSAAYPKRIILTPEEMAATNAVARDALRTWRLRRPASRSFEQVRAQVCRRRTDAWTAAR